MTMLDRILYALASPSAREIIDSLRTDPGEWEPRKSGQGVVTVLHHDAFGSVYTPDSFLWGFSDGLKSCCFDNRSRLAIRRAIKKWEKRDMVEVIITGYLICLLAVVLAVLRRDRHG